MMMTPIRLNFKKFNQIIAKGQGIFQREYASSSSKAIKERTTALYDFHKRHGGKLVNFAGYKLPVQYSDQTIIESHLHTREFASIFDVSHMLQTYVDGKDAVACLETLCTADIRGASNGTSTLTVFTNAKGGILDDLIVTKINDQLLYVVSNAAMKEQDSALMQEAVLAFKSEGKDVNITFLDSNEQSLIAIQGPTACKALSALLPPTVQLERLYFMNSIETEVGGIPKCRVTRCGYTGEDGFEISVPSSDSAKITEALLEVAPEQKVRMAGLGARDSLRLEAGLCLYGSDIDEHTTPVEAGLAWLVAKRRRNDLDFPGAEIVCKQLRMPDTVKRRRVGFQMPKNSNSPPARAGALILSHGSEVGRITSGCPSPSLKCNLGMGYIREDLKAPGTTIQLKIRDRMFEAIVTKMPFTKPNYYFPKK